MESEPVPRKGNTSKLIELLVFTIVFVSFLLYLLVGHWLWILWFDYGWPSDKGNGPEAIQQTIIYAAIAVVFVPVVRRFVKRELDKVHAKLDLAHEKMDHIIEHHPDIPPFVKKAA